jgi:hypothetical protein
MLRKDISFFSGFAQTELISNRCINVQHAHARFVIRSSHTNEKELQKSPEELNNSPNTNLRKT